jgi:hypothetical protein
MGLTCSADSLRLIIFVFVCGIARAADKDGSASVNFGLVFGAVAVAAVLMCVLLGWTRHPKPNDEFELAVQLEEGGGEMSTDRMSMGSQGGGRSRTETFRSARGGEGAEYMECGKKRLSVAEYEEIVRNSDNF